MGLTACTVTCLPFLGNWLLGHGGNSEEAMLHTGLFLAGRVATYCLPGALAGWAGSGLARGLGGAWGNAIIGGASIAAGLWLVATGQAGCCGGSPPPPATAPLRFRPQGRSGDLPPVFLGASLSLTPCKPLASLLTLAAQGASLGQGAANRLSFGLGAAVTPPGREPRPRPACRSPLAGKLDHRRCRPGPHHPRPAPPAPALAPKEQPGPAIRADVPRVRRRFLTGG